MNIKGVGIGRGVAVGPVIRMAAPLPEPSDAPRAENISAETEIARVEKSIALVNADLNRRAEEAANGDEGAKQAAPILQAIAMFASDPSLAQSIKDLINQGKTAERAVLEGFGAGEDMFRAIGGYQAERAADLHDVGQRVIADLMGAPAPGLPLSETPFVLVAEDLSPADTAALDMSKTLAIVTSQGGPTSHTAILARARGIVAVVSAAEAAELENGTNVIVNAAKGEIVVNPSEDEIAAAEAAKAAASKGGKYILEAAEAGAVEAAALCLCGIKGGVTELVILRLLLRVGKDLVGFVYFLEFFLCLSIAWVQIRVVLLGSLSKGAFYFGLGSVFIDSQYFVIICLCHCFPNFLHLPLSREICYLPLFPRKEPKRIRFGSLLLKT